MANDESGKTNIGRDLDVVRIHPPEVHYSVHTAPILHALSSVMYKSFTVSQKLLQRGEAVGTVGIHALIRIHSHAKEDPMESLDADKVIVFRMKEGEVSEPETIDCIQKVTFEYLNNRISKIAIAFSLGGGTQEVVCLCKPIARSLSCDGKNHYDEYTYLPDDSKHLISRFAVGLSQLQKAAAVARNECIHKIQSLARNDDKVEVTLTLRSNSLQSSLKRTEQQEIPCEAAVSHSGLLQAKKDSRQSGNTGLRDR